MRRQREAANEETERGSKWGDRERQQMRRRERQQMRRQREAANEETERGSKWGDREAAMRRQREAANEETGRGSKWGDRERQQMRRQREAANEETERGSKWGVFTWILHQNHTGSQLFWPDNWQWGPTLMQRTATWCECSHRGSSWTAWWQQTEEIEARHHDHQLHAYMLHQSSPGNVNVRSSRSHIYTIVNGPLLGRYRQCGMKSLPDTSTYNQQWESNPRHFGLEFHLCFPCRTPYTAYCCLHIRRFNYQYIVDHSDSWTSLYLERSSA